jgi:hypothetical protein
MPLFFRGKRKQKKKQNWEKKQAIAASDSGKNESGIDGSQYEEVVLDPQPQGIKQQSWIQQSYELLLAEIWAQDVKDFSDAGASRVLNLLSVPFQLERFVILGYLICLDSFLYIFTVLPIRMVFAIPAVLKFLLARNTLSASHRNDLFKVFLIASCSYILKNVEYSWLYHQIRGQTIIRLYVIFGVLEVLEKLCCAFGHDIINSLFETKRNATVSGRRMRRVVYLGIATLYVSFHTAVLLYQATCLNVAINSYSYALLTLLMSNQFAEIKGSVFKKFETGNLFQLACAGIDLIT